MSPPGPPVALASPTSDVGTQYREQDILEGPTSQDDILPPKNQSFDHPTSVNPVSRERSRLPDSASRPSSPPARVNQASHKRRTSDVGIQTFAEAEVDWLDGLDVDESMTAIEVSRVWAERKPPTQHKGDTSAPDNSSIRDDDEDHEPLGKFFDEFQDEGSNGQTKDGSRESDTPNPGKGIFGNMSSADEVIEQQEAQVEPGYTESNQDQELPLKQTTTPPIPSSEALAQENSPGEPSLRPSEKIVSTITAVDPDCSTSPSHIAEMKPTSQPYSFGLRELKSPVPNNHPQVSNPASVPTTALHVKPTQTSNGAKPISLSQPNSTALRARPRLYTPQPASSPSRGQELRAAPTLGRSTLGNGDAVVKTSGTLGAGEETASKVSPSLSTLRAAPTLGRSMEWAPKSDEPVESSKQAAKVSRMLDAERRSADATSGMATDYDAEYGSVLEVPSSFPPATSPAAYHERRSTTSPYHDWVLEVQTSTPQRFRAQLPSNIPESPGDKPLAGPSSAKERRPSLVPAPTNAMSLASLTKRRRSSLAPSQNPSSHSAKKIRRQYDTIESTAVPHLRAHRDDFDEFGHRTWVPKRPQMKRASTGASIKKVIGPKYQVPARDDGDTSEENQDEAGRSIHENQTENSKQGPGEPKEHEGPVYGYEQEHEKQTSVLEGTEIAETPQVARIHGPFAFDIVLAQQTHRSVAEPVEPSAAPPKAVQPSRAPSVSVPPTSPVGLGHPQMGVDSHGTGGGITRIAAITAERTTSAPYSPAHSATSQVVKFDGKRYQKRPSKLRQQRASLQITPARQPVWSPPRTRLSLGNKPGAPVVHVSKSDQEVLLQAGLKPTLKRLSDAHGFTVDVIAGVYQEMGTLKETEEALEKMKRSANKARVDLVRRKSFREAEIEVLHGKERELGSSSDESNEGGSNYLDWDISRRSSRILFGDRA